MYDLVGRLSAKFFKRRIIKYAIRNGCDLCGDIVQYRRVNKLTKKVTTWVYYVHVVSNIVDFSPYLATIIDRKEN